MISTNNSCAGGEGSGESAHLPEPCHSSIISRAGSNGDLCTVYVRSERCRESASATTSRLCNHQCVVSMRQKCSKCVVIKFLNKTFTSLSRKKDSGNRFLDVIS